MVLHFGLYVYAAQIRIKAKQKCTLLLSIFFNKTVILMY